MKNKDINHLLWEIQYAANQDKGNKDSLSFRDVLTAQIFVKSSIVHAGIFANPKFVQRAYNKPTNFLLCAEADVKSTIKEELFPSFVAAPMDEISLQNALKDEYINLIHKHESNFTFSIIHLLPLPLENDDKNNDWVKKVGSLDVKKKLDSWLENNKNTYYLENTLTTFIEQQLKDNNITNNFHTPLFLISNVDFNEFNQMKIVDKIYVYVGLIDNATEKFTWVKVSKQFLVKKSTIKYHPADPIDVKSINIEDLIEARNIHIEDNSFLSFVANNIDDNIVYNLWSIYKDRIYKGDPYTFSVGTEALSINDKKIPNELYTYHVSLYRWVDEVNKKNK